MRPAVGMWTITFLLAFVVGVVRSDLDDTVPFEHALFPIKPTNFPGCQYMNTLSIQANRVAAGLREDVGLPNYDNDHETMELASFLAQDNCQACAQFYKNYDCPSSKYYFGRRYPPKLAGNDWSPCCAESMDAECMLIAGKKRLGIPDFGDSLMEYYTVPYDITDVNQIRSIMLESYELKKILYSKEIRTVSWAVQYGTIAVVYRYSRPLTTCQYNVYIEYPSFNNPNPAPTTTTRAPTTDTTTTTTTTTVTAPIMGFRSFRMSGLGKMAGHIPFPPSPTRVCHSVCGSPEYEPMFSTIDTYPQFSLTSFNTKEHDAYNTVTQRLLRTEDIHRKRALSTATSFKWSFDGQELLATSPENLPLKRALDLEIENTGYKYQKYLNSLSPPRFLSVHSGASNSASGGAWLLLYVLAIVCKFNL